MRDTLFLLRLEHGKPGKLLGLIEDEVALADADRRVDQELLRLASEYFFDYADRCHHPKEDLVYKLLSMPDPESCAGLRDVVTDHRRLHEHSEAFADAMRRPREQPQAART